MDARMVVESLTKLLYASPIVLAGAVVLVGIVLLLVGWRLTRRRAEPLLPDIGEPGAPAAEEVPLRVPEFLSPELGSVLSSIEVPSAAPELGRVAAAAPSAAPGTREASALFRPPEQTPRPPEAKDVSPPPEPPRWRMRPEEVRSHTFRRRLRGYDPREVYEYLVAVSDELAALQRRVLEFRREGQGLQTELSRWRDQAGKVQNTLATAQRLSEEMIANAQEEATREAERIVQDALERLARLQQEIGRLEQERSRIREEIRRDTLAFAATLRDLEADSILLTRVQGPRPPATGPQEPAGP
ncbi:MAG: DivIVA domain-containing protein [Candidatus Methylomirabilales bacterium]